LAESLCDYSKNVAKKDKEGDFVASCFAFHRITGSIIKEYNIICDRELTTSDGIKLWNGPYAVGSVKNNLASYSNLVELSESMSRLPSTSIRTFLRTIYHDKTKAENDFNRILQVARRDTKDVVEEFIKRLKQLTGDSDSLLINNQNQTPLLDALRILELQKGRQEQPNGLERVEDV
jgi:hypothetical protein